MDMCFFKWEGSASSLKEVDSGLVVRTIKPSIYNNKRKFIWKTFSLFTGFYKEYNLYRGDKFVARAEVVSWLPIFGFMPKKGVHIGPCQTVEDERGKGYYPYLISRIIQDMPNNEFYMMTRAANISSIRGIEKIGFVQIATGQKTKLGRYVIVK